MATSVNIVGEEHTMTETTHAKGHVKKYSRNLLLWHITPTCQMTCWRHMKWNTGYRNPWLLSLTAAKPPLVYVSPWSQTAIKPVCSLILQVMYYPFPFYPWIFLKRGQIEQSKTWVQDHNTHKCCLYGIHIDLHRSCGPKFEPQLLLIHFLFCILGSNNRIKLRDCRGGQIFKYVFEGD